MNKDALLTFHDVAAGYDSRPIVSHVSLEVDRHTLLSLEGPNGSGKTTIIKVMLGLLAPLHGHIIRKPNLRIGYMPQVVSADLEFPITVADVILMGQTSAPRLFISHDARTRLDELINFANLGAVANKPIGQISGGQRQRAMLCRALMSKPDLLILDEPVTYMDSDAEASLYDLLPRLAGQMGVILVSHDHDASARIATQTITLPSKKQ